MSLQRQLGLMLRDAIRANATLQGVLGNSGTVHAEAGDQIDTFVLGHAGHSFIRYAGRETEDEREASATSVFRYIAEFSLVDVRGVLGALTEVAEGMTNVLADRGRTCLDTYFTDTGSNWLGKSGEVLGDVLPEPAESIEDPDRPVVRADIAVRITHKLPLS